VNRNLTVGDEKRVVWSFSLPLLLSMVFQQLYNLADSFVAGRFISERALASVGNSYEITLIFIAFAFGSNMGCGIVISQFFGAGRLRDVKKAIWTTFTAVFAMVIVLTVLGLCLLSPMLELINTPEETFADSALYLRIYILGLLFLFYYNIATGIFAALGDSRTPFVFLVISSISNIFVDILFVTVFDMGVAGVAWATFLCQGASSVSAMLALILRVRKMDCGGPVPLFDLSIFTRIVKIAVPSILQQSFVSVGNIMIQSVINSYGAAVMAGYAAAVKLNNMVVSSIMTIGNGVSSFTAQNIGAGKVDRVYRGRRAALIVALPASIIIGLLFVLFGRTLLSLFIQDRAQKAMDAGYEFFLIVAPFYFAVCLKLLTDAVLRGSGDMKPFMISTFSDLIIRVGLSFILSRHFSSRGIWMSWPVGWLLGALVALFFFVSGHWKRGLFSAMNSSNE